MSEASTSAADAGVAKLDLLAEVSARRALESCCGSTKWVSAMFARRPFANRIALKSAAREAFEAMGDADWKEAFTHHPRIGDIDSLKKKFTSTAAWASGEQAGAASASEEIFQSLKDGNDAYFNQHGFIFIVCATGKSAKEMLDLLNLRLPNSTDEELRVAAEEQTKITELRIDKLLNDLLKA